MTHLESGADVGRTLERAVERLRRRLDEHIAGSECARSAGQ